MNVCLLGLLVFICISLLLFAMREENFFGIPFGENGCGWMEWNGARSFAIVVGISSWEI